NSTIPQPILGRYDLTSEIGRGRHGVVYCARDMQTGNTVAVKIISLPNDDMLQYARDEYGNDMNMIANFVGEVAEKFGNEVASMMKVNDSDAVIKLYDNQLLQNGIYYNIIMVMEYATPMKSYFRKNRLTVGDFLRFACDISYGLISCEKQNIIHRDIKEDNLFVGLNDSKGKMGDFGVASISQTGLGATVGMGTPYYMAPEVSKGSQYDHTADIYSLGIVLYKMLNANRFPLAGNSVDSAKTALDQRMSGATLPPPAHADGVLARIVCKCCEYYPANRYNSAIDLYNDLYLAAKNMSDDELNRELPYLYDNAWVSSDNYGLADSRNSNNFGGQSNNNNFGGSANNNSVGGSTNNYNNNSGGNSFNYNDSTASLNNNSNNTYVSNDASNTYQQNYAQNADGYGTEKTVGLYTNFNTQNRQKSTGSDFLEKTMDILQNIFNNDGRNSTVAVVFNGLVQLVTNRQADAMKQQYKKRQKRNVIILVSMCVALLVVGLILLYPKTATFYVDTSDNETIHVRYLFLPDRRLDDDISASYLQVDGNWLYYSNPKEDHSLYKKSIWFGDPVLLCSDDCEYNIVIGDYIYFTSYDEGEVLCRIKKDGTAKEVVFETACRDLKRNGLNIMFKVVDTNEIINLDTTTIDQ
ncbi:MAG: protein kinase, partial [Clostridia bacterium]|nr:protein kinase [Clostridia bacterium]